jgi:quinol monooxygenase YgiN
MKLTLVLALAAAALASPLLAGCRIGYSFRGPGYDATRGVVHPDANKQVYFAITRGDIAAGSRANFSEQLRAVLDTMGEHDGLVGYAVRRELFGSRVWTMSAWVDQASMERFVRSEAHRKAVAQGGIPRSSFIAAFSHVDVERVPITWTDAERLLEEQTTGK